MTDLGQFLGAAMASAAHARRMADEESLAIAEYYRDTPGLSGMSVPRMRMPEITIELPVLVEQVDDGEDEQAASESHVRDVVLAELKHFAAAESAPISDTFTNALSLDLKHRLNKPALLGATEMKRVGLRASVDEEVTGAVLTMMKKSEHAHLFTKDHAKQLSLKLGKVAAIASVKKEGKAPTMKVTVLTDMVKNHADAGNVTRMRVVLREEGLEWASSEGPGGIERSHLTPE